MNPRPGQFPQRDLRKLREHGLRRHFKYTHYHRLFLFKQFADLVPQAKRHASYLAGLILRAASEML